MIRALLVAIAFIFAAPALGQTYPPLTGRVVDAADLLTPAQEAELTQKLAALEATKQRPLRCRHASSSPPPFRASRATTSRNMASAWAAPGGSASRAPITASSCSSRPPS